MEKTYFLIKKGRWQKVVKKLLNKFSLPEINNGLAIYFQNKNLVFEVSYCNNKCYLRSYNKSQASTNEYLDQIKSTPEIYIENKNIKYLLKILNQLNLKKATINQIVSLDFYSDNKLVISAQLDTLIGDLLVVNRNKEQDVLSLGADFFSRKLDNAHLDALIAKGHFKTEGIFNKFGVPNQKIRNYADLFGIDLSSGTNSISHQLTSKSNDYSVYERYFELLTNSKLDSNLNSKINTSFFKPVSVVIASYNSDESIIKVLRSLESQDLKKNQKKLLDVIIVDDGSHNRVVSVVQKHIKEFTFKPRVVRSEINQGLSTARNLGFRLCRYNFVVFIDSDILLSKNYLYEHSIRLQTISNAIFISFKENVSSANTNVKDEVIARGLPVPTNFNDKRLFRLIAKDTRWPNKITNEGVEELLSETNLFKSFGYGRTINGCYDLPSMVVGHNMSMKKSLVRSVGGFSDNFFGWGLEDAFFGAKAIAQGNFIIPVLTTGVFHINHPSRCGSIRKQLSEHHKNTQIYNSLTRKQL
jgi:GT2 family glycosyltransferase